jgi:hypothetical protein
LPTDDKLDDEMKKMVKEVEQLKVRAAKLKDVANQVSRQELEQNKKKVIDLADIYKKRTKIASSFLSYLSKF